MHLRRNIVLAVLLLVMFCFSCPAFAAGNTLQVHVDGKAASTEAKVQCEMCKRLGIEIFDINKLEEACIDTLNQGIMTKDLVSLVADGTKTRAVNSIDFIKAIRANLEKKL